MSDTYITKKEKSCRKRVSFLQDLLLAYIETDLFQFFYTYTCTISPDFLQIIEQTIFA